MFVFYYKGLNERAPRLLMVPRLVINTLLAIKREKNSTTSEVQFLYFAYWRVMSLQSIFCGMLWLLGPRRRLPKRIPEASAAPRRSPCGGAGARALPWPAGFESAASEQPPLLPQRSETR